MKEKYYSLANLQRLIWPFVFCMHFLYMLQEDPILQAFVYAATTTLSYAVIIYGNAVWLMPGFYRQKKYVIYLLSVMLFLALVTFSRARIQYYIWDELDLQKPHHLVFRDYLYILISHLLVFIFSIAYRFSMDFFLIRRQQEQLLKKHAESQHNLLKAQVQPHFIFNTLNNIYSVTQKESPLAADLIEKLSAIMRYFLEHGPKQEIPLTAELDFIRNYIELENRRMRFPVHTEINLSGPLQDKKIPTMLLIPLVENVFKHGMDKSKKGNFVSLDLKVADRIEFAVVNSNGQEPGRQVKGWGIGLTNLSERLAIIYGQNYVFESRRSGN
ncbi:MAG TPA: histidine kinase, partial [Puia sp.]|nr:histidine kinase [Puia sp.]